MKPKTIRILYWTLTAIFALLMLMDGLGGVMHTEDGRKVMILLGYPEYFLTIAGVSKILGAIAILQNRFAAIKEWAFAGFAINFICAAVSWAYAGDEPAFMLLPLIVLGYMLLTYYFWKRYQRTSGITRQNALLAQV